MKLQILATLAVIGFSLIFAASAVSAISFTFGLLTQFLGN